MDVIYRLVRPDGMFSPDRYSPMPEVHAAAFASSVQTISRHAASSAAHGARIDPVIVEKFRPIKVLGEGGQVTGVRRCFS